MLCIFLLELLGILESYTFPVLHNAQLLACPRLPEPQAHLIAAANNILKKKEIYELKYGNSFLLPLLMLSD
jgi:hypothetical protein